MEYKLEEVTNVLEEASYGLSNISKYVKCGDTSELSKEMLMSMSKEMLSELLLYVSGILGRCKW